MREMATAEQVQEALQELQAQGARIAALETQLRIGRTGARTAEFWRSALSRTVVTALSEGSRKGKGKRDKGQNHMSNAKCWNCGKSGHCWCDCREMWWSKEKAAGKGRLTSAESSNWQEGRLGGKSQSYRGQVEEHADGWWISTNDQTPWETEEPIGGFGINSTEGCCSKGPRRCREQGGNYAGDELEFGERFLHERSQRTESEKVAKTTR